MHRLEACRSRPQQLSNQRPQPELVKNPAAAANGSPSAEGLSHSHSPRPQPKGVPAAAETDSSYAQTVAAEDPESSYAQTVADEALEVQILLTLKQ